MTESSSFEKSMLKLEEIVKKLESGELSLEDSLKHYEQGIQLSFASRPIHCLCRDAFSLQSKE